MDIEQVPPPAFDPSDCQESMEPSDCQETAEAAAPGSAVESFMSTTAYQYAKREFDILGWSDPAADVMDKAMMQHLLRMMEVFHDEGHSGFSAGHAIACLERLLRFEPLSSLYGDASDFDSYSADPSTDTATWQCSRLSSCYIRRVANYGYARLMGVTMFYDPPTDTGFCPTYTTKESSAIIQFPLNPSAARKKTRRISTAELERLRSDTASHLERNGALLDFVVSKETEDWAHMMYYGSRYVRLRYVGSTNRYVNSKTPTGLFSNVSSILMPGDSLLVCSEPWGPVFVLPDLGETSYVPAPGARAAVHEFPPVPQHSGLRG